MTDPHPEEPESTAPRLWRATDLKPAAQPRWLAKGRLPLAAISLLVGDEGIGKSLLWVWIVAAITTGKALPEFGIPRRAPSHVILVCTEDDWSTTVLPRLTVAGADLSRITVICTEDDGSGAPTFPRDIHLIADADPQPSLIVVDAWLDTVPAGLSVRDPQQARRALHPWKEVATSTDSAVLLLCHTNRVASGNARDKYGATGELRKKARMTLFAQADDDGRLIVGPEKMNTAAPLPASTFEITGIQHFAATVDHDGTVPLLTYVGDSDRTAREHIVDRFTGTPSDEAADDIDEWLTDLLANDSVKATEVFSSADAAGFSKDQAKRAKKRLGIIADRPNNPGPWFWSLPPAGKAGSREQGAPYDALPALPALPVRSEGVEQGAEEGREQGAEQYAVSAPCSPSPAAMPTRQFSKPVRSRRRTIAGKPISSYPVCTVCTEPVLAGQGDTHLSCSKQQAAS